MVKRQNTALASTSGLRGCKHTVAGVGMDEGSNLMRLRGCGLGCPSDEGSGSGTGMEKPSLISADNILGSVGCWVSEKFEMRGRVEGASDQTYGGMLFCCEHKVYQHQERSTAVAHESKSRL